MYTKICIHLNRYMYIITWPIAILAQGSSNPAKLVNQVHSHLSMSAGAMYCQTCCAKKGRCDCHSSKQRSRSGERGGRATGSDEPMAAATGSIEDIITKAAERAATIAGEASDARLEERMASLISKIEQKQDANIADLEAKPMKEVRDLKLRQD